MNIHLISIGKLDKNFSVIAAHYTKMIKWPVKFTEISHDKKLLPEQLKIFEGKLVTDTLSNQSLKIALEVTGKAVSSHEFAKLLEKALAEYRAIDFIIGGLDYKVSSSAHHKISLSNMTMPHMLAKVILLEQIYRAQTILQNHPYHK